MDKQERVVVTLTTEAAEALAQGAELLARLGLGQLEQVAELVREGHIPVKGANKGERKTADAQACEEIDALVGMCKGLLGFAITESHGITHAHCNAATKRAWDTYQTLSLALRSRRQGLSSTAIQDRLMGRFRWIDEPAVQVAFVDQATADQSPTVPQLQVTRGRANECESMRSGV